MLTWLARVLAARRHVDRVARRPDVLRQLPGQVGLILNNEYPHVVGSRAPFYAAAAGALSCAGAESRLTRIAAG
ncbi:MAG TPA: hypothetical protein QGG47_14170 [Acidobacteriota bacterium]|nr:hypothetical protein [Acidobacteriota bacterium]